MKNMFVRFSLAMAVAVAALTPMVSPAGNYTNFAVAIYIPVNVVMSFADSNKLQSDWDRISSQVKFDKVYIEVQRDRNLATEAVLEQAKAFFHGKGIRTAAGMALSDSGVGGQFRSFCYTDPNDRAFIKQAAELAARHFDELIQDDFFFVTTKFDSDIAAKGSRSWTQFRLDLMNEAAMELLIKPAKALNPKIKMVIKFPNWYEHFHGSGFDLENEPKIFDGIYAGTETRDPEITDQNLQQYESYQIMRYFENIKPGGNGGGWVDTYSIRYIDRYAEQLWNTLFAKAKELTLFEWSGLGRPINPGDRAAWQSQNTSFNYDAMLQTYKSNAPASQPAPTLARVAGYSLEQVDSFLGKLGKPIGVASYRPHHSWGEEFLHNYFGMIGIPIDLHPTFPTNASVVLLTESAAHDSEIVAKIKGQLTVGKSVVITSGLLRALQGKGIEDIVELQFSDRKVAARKYLDGFGAGDGAVLGAEDNEPILFPDIRFLTNDAWPILRAVAGGRGYPLMLLERYGKGTLYVWTMPDNFNDLYRLPQPVTSAIKRYVLSDFPVRLDAPAQVAVFAYDNNTFIVENYLPGNARASVSLSAEFKKLRDLVTGEEIAAVTPGNTGRRRGNNERRVSFSMELLPHSYRVFAAEK
ncbi:MAG: hypothetical protein H7Y43_12440 [Akkermansiaceae bacterium]|nr:hypothetical protein [Verrucomicrobiales bacterium]